MIRGWVWQLVTYAFLHSTDNYSHILFNLLMMWMIGGDLERHWGGRKYLTYWLVCAVGAGVCVTLGGSVPRVWPTRRSEPPARFTVSCSRTG